MMEQDKQLKEILLNSAERAAANFTDAVMQKVNNIAADPFCYQPLVSPKLKRLFVFGFGALIAAILGICLIIALSDPYVVSRIQNIEYPNLNYKAILMFILSFWIVFTINSIIEKRYFYSR